MEYKFIQTEAKGEFAIVNINPTQGFNLLTKEMMAEIVDAIENFDHDDAVKVIILKGNDNHNILDYVYRGSEPIMTNESGNATIPIRWITSSPTDGKDNDQKNFWMVAFKNSLVSEPVRQTIYSDNGVSCKDIVLD